MVGSLLADGLGAEQLSALLRATRDELAGRVAADRARLERVERRLRYLEMEDHMPMEFVIKEIPATRIAQVRHAGDQGLDFGDVEQFARAAGEVMRDAIQQSGVAVTGPGYLHYEERPDGTLTPFLALPIGPSEAVDHPDVATVDVPAMTVVTAVYRGVGDHDLIGPLYGQMARYAADHGYDVYGPGRDVFVGRDDDGLVLELQLPVALGE